MAEALLTSLSARNLFDLRGVIAVVSGGGTGIGLMISATLVANGAKVYVIGLEQGPLDKIAKVYNDAAASNPSWGSMHGLVGDIRRKEEAIRLAAELTKLEGYMTVLFNNAGICRGVTERPASATAAAFQKAFFDDLTQKDFTDTIDTNAVGHYWMTFAFLPLLESWKLSRSRGNEAAKRFAPQVVMTSSMNAWTKDVGTSGCSYPYTFSKSAIGQATSSLAHELLPLGIRVNGIAPGWHDSELSAPGTADETGICHTQKDSFTYPFSVPSESKPSWPGVGGSIDDMGGLALFLVANWFVNGETVLIDGGTLLKHPSSY